MQVQIVIIERNAYGSGSGSDRFNAIKDGAVIGFGLHHKGAYRTEWSLVSTGEKYPNKAAMIAAFDA